MTEHMRSCRWENTSKEQCSYRDTHHYCPHPEHACNCRDTQESREAYFERHRARVLELIKDWPREEIERFNVQVEELIETIKEDEAR